VRNTTTIPEALAIATLCFGLFILWSLGAVAMGFQEGAVSEFNDGELLSMAGLEIILAVTALAILRKRGYDIAGLRPQPDWRGCTIGLGLYLGVVVVDLLVTAQFSNVDQQPVSQMMVRAHMSLPAILIMSVVNGTYEEVFLLGFLLRGLRGFGLSFTLGMSLLVRALYHTYQGPLGTVQILVFGLALSIYYVSSGKLWPVVFAHILGDIVPLSLAG
jgi:membrane protease YdiL (CAAX protease family)